MIYRAYTKEWCGINSIHYWNRTIILCITYIATGRETDRQRSRQREAQVWNSNNQCRSLEIIQHKGNVNVLSVDWHEKLTRIYFIICKFLSCLDSPTGPSPAVWLYKVPRSHSDTPHSVGFLWMSDQPDAETSTWQHTKLITDRHPCPPVGFEPAVPASERPQTHALDGAATGIGGYYIYHLFESYNLNPVPTQYSYMLSFILTNSDCPYTALPGLCLLWGTDWNFIYRLH